MPRSLGSVRAFFWRAALTCGAVGLLSVACAPAQAPSLLLFEDGTRASGIDFRHQPDRSARRLMPEVFGSGVILADFDRNGAVDVVLVNGGRIDGDSRPSGSENRLFLNDGRGRFRDATAKWRLPSPGYGMGGAAGDFDNDGWTDLFLTTFEGRDVLLRNEGGRFMDVTRSAGIVQDGRWSTSAGFFDLEGDGDLDLWVVRYLDYDAQSALPCFFNRQPVYCTPLREEGLPDRLLLNNGNGTFTDVSETLGSAVGKGLALAIGDVDLDGDPDVYVANDTTSNHLWINNGLGDLREQGLLAGVALSEIGKELAGMGADMSDVDGDGLVDLASTNFQGETTAVYLQIVGGVFREVSDAIGIGQSARARLSFGLDFFDADNDGDEDLLVANGHLYDNLSAFSKTVSFEQPNTLYENTGDGRFREVSRSAGSALRDTKVSRGLATGDLDGDGDLDFVINNNGSSAQVGVNQSAPCGAFVSLWLEGRRANRSAFGARVEAQIGARTITRQVHAASSYLSMNDSRIHLGLGDASQVDRLEVYWPGSEPQIIGALAAGKHYYLVEGESPVSYVPGAFPAVSNSSTAATWPLRSSTGPPLSP